MKEKEKPMLQLEAQKDPGPYVSYTYRVNWLENGVITRLPHESVRNFEAAKGFEAAGKRYSSFTQLRTEKESDYTFRDIYGRQVFEVKERFPCFDSYDYLNEDRYYRWLYIQENGMLCCIYYADSRKEMSVTEDAEKVNERSYKAMKESGYCDCI